MKQKGPDVDSAWDRGARSSVDASVSRVRKLSKLFVTVYDGMLSFTPLADF